MHYTLYVSPNGDDKFDGLSTHSARGSKGPFATLERARDEIRTLKKANPGASFNVVLRGGTYYLPDTFVLEPEDSGTEDNPIVYSAYPGERPVLSGGRRITGFQREIYKDKACWTVTLDEVTEGNWYFRQLFVNGLRRNRPRLPKKGFYNFTGIPEGANAVSKSEGPWFNGPDKAYFKPGDISAQWYDKKSIDIVTLQQWFSTHHKIKSIDEPSSLVEFYKHSISTLKDESGKHFARYFADNVFEALSEPGEWYLDRESGLLRYLPLTDEDIDSACVVAPRLQTIMRLAGTEENPVTNVIFKNISFQHAEWHAPNDYIGSVQAAFHVPGSVVFEHAEKCCLKGCEIVHVSQYGLEIGWGSHKCEVDSCNIYDMGAGGIRINHEWYKGKKTVSTNYYIEKSRPGKPNASIIKNCSIHDGTLIYPGAVGVFIGNAGFVKVLNNHIYNLNYTGISSGWTWNYDPTATIGIQIEGNHIHHICWRGPLSDNGAIYLLGQHPGGVVANNHIHHIGCHHYGGTGIYPDQASSFLKVYNNIIHHTRNGFNTHFGRSNHVFNNIFALVSENAFKLGNPEEVRSCVFENNIIYSRDGKPAANVFDKRHGLIRNNLFYQEGLPENFASGFSMEYWQGKGQLDGCLVKDPLFADPDGGDFSIREDSPAYEIGFKPFPKVNVDCNQKDDVTVAAIELEWLEENRLKVTLTNYGLTSVHGELKLVCAPENVIRISGTDTMGYRELAPGKTCSAEFELEILNPDESYRVEAIPADKSINPAMISKVKGSVLKLGGTQPVAKVSEIKDALDDFPWQDVYESKIFIGRWKLAVAGESLLFLAQVNDPIQVLSNIPWEGSAIEFFLAPRDTISKKGLTQLVFSPNEDWCGVKVFRPKNGPVPATDIIADCKPTDKGYELSAMIPGTSVNFPQGVKINSFMMELTMITTVLDGINLKYKRVFGAKAAHANSIGYGRIVIE